MCTAPGADTGNSANCDLVLQYELTDVGAYALSASPYGTYDQGGNAWERTEQYFYDLGLIVRGGSWSSDPVELAAWRMGLGGFLTEGGASGFRVASLVPEPCTALLIASGLVALGLCARRGARDGRRA